MAYNWGHVRLLEDGAVEENWEWDPETATDKAIITGATVRFNPEGQHWATGAVAVRATKALTSDTIAYWEIVIGNWRELQQVGIVTPFCILKTFKTVHLLGEGALSVGLNSYGYIKCKGVSERFCASIRACRYPPRLPAYLPTVGLMFNGPAKELRVFINNNCVGRATLPVPEYSGLYYPAVASLGQDLTMHLLPGSVSRRAGLKDLCATRVRKLYDISPTALPIPKTLMQRLRF